MSHDITDQYGRLLDEEMLKAAKRLLLRGEDTFEGDYYSLKVIYDKRDNNSRQSIIKITRHLDRTEAN